MSDMQSSDWVAFVSQCGHIIGVGKANEHSLHPKTTWIMPCGQWLNAMKASESHGQWISANLPLFRSIPSLGTP